MSNIGSKSKSFGKDLNIVISNGTEAQFNNLAKNDIALQSKNAMIISIPQENGKDKIDSVSLWLTDDDGYLLEISKPINSSILEQEIIDNIIENVTNNVTNNAQERLNQYLNEAELALSNYTDIDSLKQELQEIAINGKNNIEAEKNNIKEELRQYINIDATITKEVQAAYEKINTINKKLDQDINKIIWNCPNVAYLAHIVRRLCQEHNITYDFDNEYSEAEVLHNEHHDLTQRVLELENKIEQLSH